ncbi:hypothetical protein ISU07_17880 [Nocardioides islandensis]|uniref:DUF7669 domain-containing protein n=1 Tax=Nocardioides islandensis TaxID=433663 RepID=A0A930VHS6_9ACTN|nr:hypothetical protein [Nocardioides islandensis]MBF4765005.1 hypothetical protein [Nocardioides islandensis]
MVSSTSPSVWELLQNFAATQRGSFTTQDVVSWFRRHAPAKANDQTVRTHVRGACWNVGDRSQFSHREPFLTRLDRGVFRRATLEEIERWAADESHDGDRATSRVVAPHHLQGAASDTSGLSDEWHTDANIQSALVTALAVDGWRIVSVANTATKEHGIDVIADHEGQTVGIEVKGFPSRQYADPARRIETKRTNPSTQAAHWYAQAVLAAMRLRGKEPTWRSVIALPDFRRYRDLHAETVGSLSAAQIDVWWVNQVGEVDRN